MDLNKQRSIATERMEQEQILHEADRRARKLAGTQIGSGAMLDAANQRPHRIDECGPMCARETARSLIISNIDRLDRERAGLVALLDVLPPALHQFHPQADEALFEMVSRRR